VPATRIRAPALAQRVSQVERGSLVEVIERGARAGAMADGSAGNPKCSSTDLAGEAGGPDDLLLA
jgi:hypothetical protein